MNEITLTLVRTIDGTLVGRTASDRWNLETLRLSGIEIGASVSGTHRRTAQKLGIRLSIARPPATIVPAPSWPEIQALNAAAEPLYVRAVSA